MNIFKQVLVNLVFALPLIAPAQITEIATVTGRYETLVTLEQAGPKFIQWSSTGFNLFNTDLTPFLSATYPALPAEYYYLSSPSYITEATFDQDASTVEYVVQFHDQDYENYGILVARADGTVLLVDSTYSLGGVNGPDAYTSRGSVMNTDDGTVMVLIQGMLGSSRIYSLPGTLPCLSCADGGIGMGMVPDGPKPSFELFPNPTDGIVNINYSQFKMHRGLLLQLYDASGRQIRSMRLDDSGTFSFSTSGLAKGSYHAMLADGTRELGITKTFIVE